MKAETLKKLRDRKPVLLWDRANKLFVQIQFNKKEKGFVCWEKWVSKDRINWVNHNLYLSLKDVRQIINNNKTNPPNKPQRK